MELLWAVYLQVCLQSTCFNQEIQRFDSPQAKVDCEKSLISYYSIPADGNWDSVEWVCKPLGSTGT
jgi:hypothetical protein